MTAHLKRIFVGFFGGLVLFIGVLMIVLPGPALIVIPAGLAILATQFEWARRLRDRVKERIHRKRMEWKQKK